MLGTTRYLSVPCVGILGTAWYIPYRQLIDTSVQHEITNLGYNQGSPYRSIPAYRDLAGMVRDKAPTARYILVRQLTGMRFSRYRAVSSLSIRALELSVSRYLKA
ncbi:hypothetical protein BHM03_00013310 [Ensete ventricosum]|nr:hypothetical protein BHM03_00013310 [Ensete ventricosum]